MSIEYTGFTRRTEDPKLGWIERQLDELGIAHRRNGHTFHAPKMEVDKERFDEAWDILNEVDDISDDNPDFLL
jgi:hypothetical protein